MQKDFILKKRKDFVRVASGKRLVQPNVVLQAAPSLSETEVPYKVGFTTTKKIGKAHIRNRARRRMRAVAREIFPKLGRDNHEYVLVGRYNTAFCPYKELKGDLRRAVKQIHRMLRKAQNEETSHTSD